MNSAESARAIIEYTSSIGEPLSSLVGRLRATDFNETKDPLLGLKEVSCEICKETFFVAKSGTVSYKCKACRIREKNERIRLWSENMKTYFSRGWIKYGINSKNYLGRERTRVLVRMRDDFTCQDCGAIRLPTECGNGKKYKRSFDVHHTNGECGKKSRAYDKTSDLSGMITLCHKCHFNRHDRSSAFTSHALS